MPSDNAQQPKARSSTARDKPISLAHMSIEDALRKALNTPKPTKGAEDKQQQGKDEKPDNAGHDKG